MLPVWSSNPIDSCDLQTEKTLKTVRRSERVQALSGWVGLGGGGGTVHQLPETRGMS